MSEHGQTPMLRGGNGPEMKQCPYCAEEIREAAIKCRHCGSALAARGAASEWYRLRRGRMLAGVCAGLAEHLGVSVTALRLAAVLLTLVGFGWGVLIYFVLWIIMPIRDELEPESDADAA